MAGASSLRSQTLAKQLNEALAIGAPLDDDILAALHEYFDNGNEDDEPEAKEEQSDEESGGSSASSSEYDSERQLSDDGEPDTVVIEEGQRDIFTPSHAAEADSTSSLAEEDQDESKKLRDFFASGCGCSRRCSVRFAQVEVKEHREHCQSQDFYCPDLHVNHLNLMLLGVVDANMSDSNHLQFKNGKKNVLRRKAFLHCKFKGSTVCKSFFMFAFAISDKRLRAIRKTVCQKGLAGKSHGNSGKKKGCKPESLAVKKRALAFIKNYAMQQALVLPGRVPGVKNSDVFLLPSSIRKIDVYRLYLGASKDCSSISRSTFYDIWKTFVPYIVIQQPRSDLCATCQAGVLKLATFRRFQENQKLEHVAQLQHHLQLAATERAEYKAQIETCRAVPEGTTLGSRGEVGAMHYSFDFAQQVHLPHDSQQVGPLYFLAPYKVGLFGIACEPLGQMALYVIPEAAAAGKGSNTVISLLHHFFAQVGVGEKNVYLHADNCVGQNKNNHVLHYLMFRVATGMHDNITLSFMPVGHTKFAPDAYFGVFKRQFRKSSVASLEQLRDCADRASTSGKLLVQMVGTESGDILIPTLDWVSKFDSLSRVSGIKQYHCFEFDKAFKGQVRVSLSSSSREESEMIVLAEDISVLSETLPARVEPPGLSALRKAYLYSRIREYVPEGCKDVLCPKPSCAPANEQKEPDLEPEEDNIAPVAGLSRKRGAPTCGYCKETGHRNSMSSLGKFACPKRRKDSEDL